VSKIIANATEISLAAALKASGERIRLIATENIIENMKPKRKPRLSPFATIPTTKEVEQNYLLALLLCEYS